VARPTVAGASALARGGRRTLIAIGNFDGVHLGHRAVLERAVARARREGLVPAVLTFHPHPAVVLGRPPPATLTPLERKVTLVQSIADDLEVVVHPFDAAFAALSPEEFAERLLVRDLGAQVVAVGQNFRFGKGRSGTFDTLQALGARLGFDVWAEPLAGDERGRWSSTRARASVASGDVTDVELVLGRPYELEGVVVHGQHRGRTIGFPTANLDGIAEAIPASGVYAIEARTVSTPGAEGARLAGGVANIGVRPTVAAGFAVEAHLFDFQGDLYGARLRLRLVARLREERTFPSFDELKAQISRDAASARDVLAARGAVDAAGTSG
jgi:riboflavin kinase/FMN adenylyltransferase